MMPDYIKQLTDEIGRALACPSMNPVVIGVRELVRQIVPSAKLEKVKFDPDYPEKFVRIQISNACKTLLIKLRNIIHAGDCGGYVLLRKQLADFTTICQEPLEKIPNNDARPLMKLREEVENCDKSALIQKGMGSLRHLITQTSYFPQEEQRDNKWKILEIALLEVMRLAKEFSLSLDEIQKLVDEYYMKHVDGVLWEIEQDEQGASQFVTSEFYGGGWGSFAKKDPKEIRTKLVSQLSGKLSEPISMVLLAKIEKHGKDALIRKGKAAFGKLSFGELSCYYTDLQYLKATQQEISAAPGRFDHAECLIDGCHGAIVSDGSLCISPVRSIVKVLLGSQSVYEGLDAQFVGEMQELLIGLHSRTIESALAIKQKQYCEALRHQSISDRLRRMKEDIDLCNTNKARFPVWSGWHNNFSACISPPSPVFLPNRPVPGGAFGKRKRY